MDELEIRAALLPRTGLDADPDAAFSADEFVAVALAFADAGDDVRAAEVLGQVTGPCASWPLPWGSKSDAHRISLMRRLVPLFSSLRLDDADSLLWDAADRGDAEVLAVAGMASSFWADLAAHLGSSRSVADAARNYLADAQFYIQAQHPARAICAARGALRWGCKRERAAARNLMDKAYGLLGRAT